MDAEPSYHRGAIVSLPGVGFSVGLPDKSGFEYLGEVPDRLGTISETRLTLAGLIGNNEGFLNRRIGPFLDRLYVRSDRSDLEEKVMSQVEDPDRINAHCLDFAEDNLLPASRKGKGLRYKNQDYDHYFVIFKKSGLGQDMGLFADGHESGELLMKIGQEQALQDALKAEGILVDVRQYHGEDFADLGGFLALLRAKKAGNETIRIPFFRTNVENREKMGRELFGLEPSIGPKQDPR